MAATCHRKPTMALFARFIFSLILIHHHQVTSEPTEDRELLFTFIEELKFNPRVNWSTSLSTCDWFGVICDLTNNSVTNLRLPGASLIGKIPENTIGKLSGLRVLSLHDNGLTGSIPSDFTNLKSLRKLVLHNNKFTGQLPNINSEKLKMFNVSNNYLNSSIPSSLSKFNKTVFSGNIHLCDNPFPKCNNTKNPEPAPQENKPKNKLSTGTIVGIAVGSPLVILILLSCLRKERNNNQAKIIPPEVDSRKDELTTSASTEGNINKFVFFDGGIFSFGLEDLSRASAEVLGKGSIGTTYKRLLEEGTTVVVKQLKDVSVTKMKFDSQMEVLGNMKNKNVAPLRGFYYSTDEKLLVYDYLPGGSLHARLHGCRGSSQTPLDWDHRKRIALSAARGVAYLHEVGKIVHGNIKSSNILLGQETNKDVFVSDYGLNTLFGIRATFKSDVYNFGVLLLELLTGKAPNQGSLGEEGIDLPKWVRSVERMPEVFDLELTRFQNTEEVMVQMLKIALTCVSIMPDKRPTMQEMVRMMEDMNQVEMVEIITD